MNPMRWLRTLRYLRPVQIYRRLWLRLYRPRVETAPAPARRLLTGAWIEPVSDAPSLLSRWQFRFLDETAEVGSATDWDDPARSKLWRYNLHYFDDLNAKDAVQRCRWHEELLQRWVDENPPARGSGWEPYPTSLRIVNWIKWALAGNELAPACQQSLALQARWLMRRLEYHLLGNHLLANAKALIFCGLYFDGSEAERWLQTGRDILRRELDEQILADGGHFERSPMYHALVLEDLLDITNLQRAAGTAAATFTDLPERARAMHRWLAVMCHPDGEIGFFNDAAFGIAPNLAELEAYARRLGLTLAEPAADELLWLPDSGYLRIARADVVALLDIAAVGPDYLPGHAHADTLSFELSLFGQRLLVNSGTSTYALGTIRQQQRSSAAHNTVVVDGLDSSEVWASFRVGRRARAQLLGLVTDSETPSVSACHDGYAHLPGRVRHVREWRCGDDHLTIVDRLEGRFETAVAYFHLHPSASVALDGAVQTARLTLPDSRRVEMRATGAAALRLSASTWHPRFGESVPAQCLEIEFGGASLEVELRW